MINGYLKTSFVDYPDRMCSVIFFGNCNFRCPFCHNPALVFNNEPEYSWELIENHLEKRKGIIEAVTITGGEPTMSPELVLVMKKLKERNLLIKLDTNGSNPKMLKQLIDEKLVDYIAMDMKAPFSNYKKVILTDVNPELMKESAQMIMNSGIEYEFRTTVHSELLNEDDIIKMSEDISGAKRWCLQVFMNYNDILDPKYMENNCFDMGKLKEIAKRIKSTDNITEIIVR